MASAKSLVRARARRRVVRRLAARLTDARTMKGQNARPVGDASAAKKRRTWRSGRPESDEGEERSAAAARRHEDRVDGGKKAARNALRSAQLEKRELLLFRKFGYGPRLFSRYYREQRLACTLPQLE